MAAIDQLTPDQATNEGRRKLLIIYTEYKYIREKVGERISLAGLGIKVRGKAAEYPSTRDTLLGTL